MQVPCPTASVRRGFLPGPHMYFAYVLGSLGKKFVYKGHCEDLQKRLKQHNAGMTRSTRPFIPLEIIYVEEFETREEAREREKFFKSAGGRKVLKEKLELYFNARPTERLTRNGLI